MAFLVRSPEIPTVSARIFSDANSSVISHVFMRRKVTVSAIDARDLPGVKNPKSRLYWQFSAPVKEDYKISREEEEEEEEDKQSYYVNMGHAVRSIREEFPLLFYKELNFDIYRFDEDSRFKLNCSLISFLKESFCFRVMLISQI